MKWSHVLLTASAAEAVFGKIVSYPKEINAENSDEEAVKHSPSNLKGLVGNRRRSVGSEEPAKGADAYRKGMDRYGIDAGRIRISPYDEAVALEMENTEKPAEEKQKREAGIADLAGKLKMNMEALGHKFSSGLGSKIGTEAESEAESGAEPEKTTISARLAVDDTISVFSRYTRNDERLTERFAESGISSLVFAPADSALERSGIKPWSFPDSVSPDMPECQQDKTVESNIRHFIAEHIVLDFDFNVLKSDIMGPGAEEVAVTSEMGRLLISRKCRESRGSEEAEFEVVVMSKDGTTELETLPVLKYDLVENGLVFVIDGSIALPGEAQ